MSRETGHSGLREVRKEVVEVAEVEKLPWAQSQAQMPRSISKAYRSP